MPSLHWQVLPQASQAQLAPEECVAPFAVQLPPAERARVALAAPCVFAEL